MKSSLSVAACTDDGKTYLGAKSLIRASAVWHGRTRAASFINTTRKLVAIWTAADQQKQPDFVSAKDIQTVTADGPPASIHHPPYQESFVGPAHGSHLAFQPYWPGLLYCGRGWFSSVCLVTAPDTRARPRQPKAPGQGYFRRGSCALRVSPFVLVDRGLNLEYVEGSQLGHALPFRASQIRRVNDSDFTRQVVTRRILEMTDYECRLGR